MLSSAALPCLSVVIPSHSQVALLKRCLYSLARYAPPNTEILVIDDGSIQAAVSRTASQFPGVWVERLPRPGGFCRAANHGLKMARAGVIQLLNDDAWVTPGWAEAVLPWFADPRIAAVAPLVLCEDGRKPPRVDSAGDDYDSGGFALKRGHGQPLSAIPRQPMWVFGASASSAFYRRAALDQVGCFPEFFEAYFEDVDLACRLQAAGYQTLFEPRSVVWHRVGASHRRAAPRLICQQSRNEERLFWRNLPLGGASRDLPRHLAVLAGKALRRWREGTLIPWCRGRSIAFGEWASLLRQRRGLFQRSGKCKRPLAGEVVRYSPAPFRPARAV